MCFKLKFRTHYSSSSQTLRGQIKQEKQKLRNVTANWESYFSDFVKYSRWLSFHQGARASPHFELHYSFKWITCLAFTNGQNGGFSEPSSSSSADLSGQILTMSPGSRGGSLIYIILPPDVSIKERWVGRALYCQRLITQWTGSSPGSS